MSVTIVSWIVNVLTGIGTWTGVPFVSGSFDGFVTTVGWIASVLGIYFGRKRIGDITWWGGRK